MFWADNVRLTNGLFVNRLVLLIEIWVAPGGESNCMVSVTVGPIFPALSRAMAWTINNPEFIPAVASEQFQAVVPVAVSQMAERESTTQAVPFQHKPLAWFFMRTETLLTADPGIVSKEMPEMTCDHSAGLITPMVLMAHLGGMLS